MLVLLVVLLFNFNGLEINCTIGKGGEGGKDGNFDAKRGKDGSDTKVNITNNLNLPVQIFNITPNTIKGMSGNPAIVNTGGKGGEATSILGYSAGAGGNGSSGVASGTKGSNGAVIMLFYK